MFYLCLCLCVNLGLFRIPSMLIHHCVQHHSNFSSCMSTNTHVIHCAASINWISQSMQQKSSCKTGFCWQYMRLVKDLGLADETKATCRVVSCHMLLIRYWGTAYILACGCICPRFAFFSNETICSHHQFSWPFYPLRNCAKNFHCRLFAWKSRIYI